MALPKSNPRVSASMKMKRVSDALKPQKTAMAKRGSTLKNKAGRLSKLCDIAVYMIAVGADGKINAWPENQQDLKSVLLKYKNLKRGFKDGIEKGLFSVEKGFLEIVDDRENRDLGIQDNCLGAKLESLNERIGAVTMKMMRDDGKCSFMDLYKNIMEPDAADQQQLSSLNLNLNLDPTDLVVPTPKPNLIGEINLNLDPEEPQEQPQPQPPSVPSVEISDDDMKLLLSDCEIGLMEDDMQFCDNLDDYEPTVDTIYDFLSWVLGDEDQNDNGAMEDDVQPQSTNHITDDEHDDIRLLLTDCEIGLMQEDLQFCDNDLSDFLGAPLETMLLQDPQHHPHSELNLNF
ncbi:uncharacterized protein LOC117632916 [Prunus dulcis]|uniref:uncharacterized protein LOC117632915 n=1 Tax=Prunus dulcis TaxID=3755 RepID=UPI0014830FB6|nr:uncharacterized protein LOC117632915 [Prunus dulcis]XP_034222443.1 uncharacterized protein LOC117632916 [Prunus dulcis]